jgi:hypothetical protein
VKQSYIRAVLPVVLAVFGLLHAEARQSSEFASVDDYALRVPKSESTSVAHLASVLAKGAQNDREKARVIYRWITQNITYDTQAFFSGELGDMSADNVLKTMKGVCDGYTQLFTALAKAMGLEAIRIPGNSKGYGYVVGARIEGPADHVWNAVKLNGRWNLLDCTWGAGSVDDRKQFVRRFSDYYFLTPAEQFIYDHFPEESDKQFLSPAVSKDTYERLVSVQPPFFRFGLKLKSHREGIIRVNDRADVLLHVPKQVLLLTQVLRDGTIMDPTLSYVSRSFNEATVTARFPSAGTYILRIFAKHKDDGGQGYEKAIDYRVIVNAPTIQATTLPVLYEPFERYDISFQSPTEREANVEQHTSVLLNAAPDITMVASLERDGTKLDETYTFVQRENDFVRVQAVFPQSGLYFLTVFAKRKSESGNYSAIFKYKFVSNASKDPAAGFPALYEQFYARHAFLVSPMTGLLRSGRSTMFRLQVPGAQDVAVVSNGQWTHLANAGERFEGDVPVITGKIEVVARFPGSQQYVGLLKYTGL